MSIKIRKNILSKYFIVLLLIPFFELQTYNMFIENGTYSGLFGTLLSLYSALRLLITAGTLIYVLKKPRIEKSNVAIMAIAFVMMENLSSAINGSLYINYTIGSFAYIGFVFLLQLAIRRNQDGFIKGCMCLFVLLSVLGAFQIIIMPQGFLNHDNKAFAIYLLGAKNTSFFYYTVALFFLLYYDLSKFNRIRKRSFVLFVLFACAAIRCDSMNTLIMMLILFVFCVVINHAKILCEMIQPPVIILAIIVIAFVILSPQTRVVLVPVLEMIGRDIKFTGRDVLWIQAINGFKEHPLFGNGIFTKYLLETGVWQDSAHSQFLDLLSKYGIFVFAAFICMPVFALRGAIHRNGENTKTVALKCSVCFIILLHSVVDHIPIYHFILLMISMELLTINDCERIPSERYKTMKGYDEYGGKSVEKIATDTVRNS